MFEKAEIPSLPFLFSFYTDFDEIEVEKQKLFNKKTNEAFWITKPCDYTRMKWFIVKKDEVGANSQKT